jgi:hypothetical protein
MYEKDGEKYYIFDSHLHFWDASPENWVKGHEEYAKGWIECFHAYQGLGPADTHWTLEHFQKYSADDFEKDVFQDGGVDKAVLQSTYLKEWYTNGFNDIDQNAALLDRFGDKLILNGRWDPREGQAGIAQLEKDVFDEGHVDVAIFQPTYLKEWYTNGFNTAEQDSVMAARNPDKSIVNGRFDPRDGDPGLRQLEEDHAKYGHKGVKLYTAEWNSGSRGYKLSDDIAQPYFEKCIELGISNIHVHKGPTIWPLDKDAFDVADVDKVATRYQELNFIVEHVGLPRIEDFCFMATQERNVYAGLAVVIGGLMHARPRFFAKVMGELLFWVGEDKMIFGADYAIWEPKWQVEGFVDWQMPDGEEFSDYGKLTVETKKKILGLNAAKLYDVEVPAELRLAGEEPAAREAAQLVES